MDEFERFVAPMIGLRVSGVWRGHGSAIFLELGEANSIEGSDERTPGAFTVMIEWSWRIEDATSILCGSFSDDALIEEGLFGCVGRTVERVELFARLPEVSVALSGDRHLASFMTADRNPEWTIFDNRAPRKVWAHTVDGRVVVARDAEGEAA